LEQLLPFLEKFYVITDLLSSESHVTISSIKPILANLLSNTLLAKNTDSSILADLKSLIKQDLELRFSSYQNFENELNLSSFLDPRFKNLNFLSELQKSQVISFTEQEYKSEFEASPPQEQFHLNEPFKKLKISGKSSKSKVAQLVYGNEYANQEIDEEIKEIPSWKTHYNAALKKYLNENLLLITGDPLLWWKEKENEYPVLSRIARKFLGITATSAPSERIFSKAGFIMNERRLAMKDELLDELIFLSHNSFYF